MIKASEFPRLRKIILIIAIVGFAVGLYLALEAHPISLLELNVPLILLSVGFLIPIVLILNGFEFYISAKMLGAELSMRSAIETIVVGSAANMLPIPGSALAKVGRLKAHGISYKNSTLLTLFLALVWLCIASIYAGLWLVVLEEIIVGLVLSVGASSFLIGLMIKANQKTQDANTLFKILAARSALVFIAAIQLYVCFWIINLDYSFAQASILSLSGVLGSAASVVPSGIGVMEGIGAFIGSMISMTAATAFLSVSLLRILNLITILPIAIFLTFYVKSKKL